MADTIDIELDRNTLNVVVRVFSYMLDNYTDPNKIDCARILQSFDEIENITNKLKSQVIQNEERVVISMNFSDWVSYSGLITYTNSGLPDQRVGDMELLDDLSDEYYYLDEEGRTPNS